MADGRITPELGWIGTCAEKIAGEACDILAAVLREMDLMHDPRGDLAVPSRNRRPEMGS
jgi:hypothetical protein